MPARASIRRTFSRAGAHEASSGPGSLVSGRDAGGRG